MKDALVFDVGGTNLRAARYSFESKKLIAVKKSLTPNNWNSFADEDAPFDLLINEMKVLSAYLFIDDKPEVVTIGFPGPITPDGKVLSTPTIWGSTFKGSTELIPQLKRCWAEATVNVINDVTAAGYFLKTIFPGDFCVITVSSGIGSKLFIDGRPYTGKLGRGGEIGHWVTDLSTDALLCECGGKGHLGGIASGRGTLEFAKKYSQIFLSDFISSLPGEMTKGNSDLLCNEILVKAFRAHDRWTEEVIAKPGQQLAKAIAMIHTTTGIESFIIIGGFAIALGERYRVSLVESAEKFCWKLGQNWDDMIHLGPDETEMGLIGSGIYSNMTRPIPHKLISKRIEL